MDKTTHAGTVNGIEGTYDVYWDGIDYATIWSEGEQYVTGFCSSAQTGFVDTDDVLDQAMNMVYDWESSIISDNDEEMDW